MSAMGLHLHAASSGNVAVLPLDCGARFTGGCSLHFALQAEWLFSVTGEEFEVLCPCQLSEVREAYLCESDRQQLLVNVAEK